MVTDLQKSFSSLSGEFPGSAPGRHKPASIRDSRDQPHFPGQKGFLANRHDRADIFRRNSLPEAAESLRNGKLVGHFHTESPLKVRISDRGRTEISIYTPRDSIPSSLSGTNPRLHSRMKVIVGVYISETHPYLNQHV